MCAWPIVTVHWLCVYSNVIAGALTYLPAIWECHAVTAWVKWAPPPREGRTISDWVPRGSPPSPQAVLTSQLHKEGGARCLKKTNEVSGCWVETEQSSMVCCTLVKSLHTRWNSVLIWKKLSKWQVLTERSWLDKATRKRESCGSSVEIPGKEKIAPWTCIVLLEHAKYRAWSV